ncbi:MAG: hypothetical protein M1833_005223 [Piccolia ochrophora]|nr:MAG: hypothetical protein M1833_005223 [Piccolia ochrophora]
MASDPESEDFEFVDSLEVAKQVAADKKPDLLKIRAWLKPTDYTAPSSEFNRHLSSQAPGTGEWIRETIQFNQWHSSSNHGSIWIKAVPGAGKSVVAASMVDSISRRELVPVLYFFFRQIIEASRTPRSLLRDWMSQLLPSSEMLQVSLWELLEEKADLESISTDELWRFLLASLRVVDKAYCVVDALDEMSFDDDFLAQLNSLGSFRPAHVKVMITSRPKQYLQRALKDPQVIHVSLEEELVKRDISVFVCHRVAEFNWGGCDPKTRELIIGRVCERSQGLFLYARLMLDQIAQSIKEGHEEVSVREMVAKLPLGLEEMYNRVLFDHATLTNVHQTVQVLILSLVTHSARPMRLIEIAEAVGANPHISTRGRDRKDIVRTACGPLLEILEDELVQILHHSFTEFLLDTNRLMRSTSQFPVIVPATAHRDIAVTCLDVLQGDAFNTYPDCNPNEDEVVFAKSIRGRSRREFNYRPIFLKHPLVSYAATKWPYHTKRYCAEDQNFFDTLGTFFKTGSRRVRAWLELMSGEYESAVSLRNATPLHIAAGFGLSPWAKHLIQRGADLDALDSTENSPLFWASKGGHPEVVELLLNAGARPDVEGYDGSKPLHVAGLRNRADVVKLLLAAGVSPTTPKTKEVGRKCGNAPTSIGHHALMYASQRGHVETILEMIPHAKREDLEDALCWAAARGHFRLLSALLEHSDVSPDAVSRNRFESIGRVTGGETALMCAAGSLEPRCVRKLLERGASVHNASSRDMNRSGSFYLDEKPKPQMRNALHSLALVAINSTREPAAKEIFDMLLAAGADLEARDGSGNTPLLLCIGNQFYERDSPRILNLLLSAGADPCAMDSNGETLLHRACKTLVDTKVTKQLLGHKADPGKARSSDGATPLHCAVKNIHCPSEHLELLVSHGADVNVQDSNGSTPLHKTCEDNITKERLVETLLNLGANVNLQNTSGETCLHNFQCSNIRSDRNHESAHSIIDAGADLELRNHDGMTVLLYAVAKNTRMVDVLLQHAMKPLLSARTYSDGKTALHLACQSQKPLELIKTLVSHGANPKWIDNDGNTLLHEIASRFSGYPEEIALVEDLFKMGLSMDAKNFRRQTAAHIVAPVYCEDGCSTDNPTRQSLVSVFFRLNPRFDVNVQDVKGYTPLHFAAAASESQTFNLIRAGADLNAKAFNLRTPLHCAARGRQSDIIAMLLQFMTEGGRRIDIEAADENGRRPLHDACRSGRPESVRLLIDAGANVQVKAQQDRRTPITPLSACAEFTIEDKVWCCMRNNTASSDFIIRDAFRPVSMTDSQRQTHPAEDHRQHDTARVGVIAKMLVEDGADTDGALHSALSARNPELVAAIRQLTKSEDADKAHGSTATPVILPISNASPVSDIYSGYGAIKNLTAFIPSIDEATMEASIAQSVDFTKVEPHSWDKNATAISKIAELGLTEYMKNIILKGKFLDDHTNTKDAPETTNATSHKERPVLHIACDRPMWNMEMVRLLVTEGRVDVNAHQQVKEMKNYQETGNAVPGPTALHVLAKGNFGWQVEAIKFLVGNGARVDALDELGRTPLEIASTQARYGTPIRRGFFRPQCCETLVQLGADLNRANPEGLTPLNKAGSDGDIIKVLLKHGADVNVGTKGVLMSAVEAGDVHTLRLYLENGADCNVPDCSTDSSYRTGLACSLPKRYPIVVAAFPPSYAPWDRSTPTELVKVLLEHGAEVDLPVSDKETILHYLFRNVATSVLRPLVETAGLNFNIRDRRGRTVFMAACDSYITSESGRGIVTQKEAKRLKAEYTPAYMLLANSELYGSSIDYLAVDDESRHTVMYLLPKWNNTVEERFLPVPGIRALILQKDKAGFSPLHYALRAHDPRTCFQFITEGSADLLEPDPNGDTALHHLVRCIYMSELERVVPVMEKYVTLGGSIDARNRVGETPLLAHLASGYQPFGTFDDTGHLDNLKFFVDNGADFRAAKNNGETAMHIVARREPNSKSIRVDEKKLDYNAELFERLVGLGCDPLREDEGGRTALDVAAAVGNEGILRLYQRRKDGEKG